MSEGRLDIAPSILASDFLNLGEAVRQAEHGCADRLHIDVMDGRFVPNISVGIPIVRAIRGATTLFLETHLMIVEPERYISDFAEAGADLITVHVEVSPHIFRTVQHIHHCGKKAGVAINPGTPWTAVEEVLELADLVLVMTVNPGFGGQEFISSMLPKIERVAETIARHNLNTRIEVDGGIDDDTVPLVVAAGATVLVAGTSVFRSSKGVGPAIADLRAAGNQVAVRSNLRQWT